MENSNALSFHVVADGLLNDGLLNENTSDIVPVVKTA